MFRCGLSWLTSSSGLCLGGGAERRSRTGVGVELVDAELVRVKLGEAQLAKVGQWKLTCQSESRDGQN